MPHGCNMNKIRLVKPLNLKHWYFSRLTHLPRLPCSKPAGSTVESTNQTRLNSFFIRHLSFANPAYWWLHPSTEVISVLQHIAISQYLAAGRRDTVKEASWFQVRLCGIHCHRLLVTHCWHWLSSVHFWRLCFLAEHMNTIIAPLWQFRL